MVATIHRKGALHRFPGGRHFPPDPGLASKGATGACLAEPDPRRSPMLGTPQRVPAKARLDRILEGRAHACQHCLKNLCNSRNMRLADSEAATGTRRGAKGPMGRFVPDRRAISLAPRGSGRGSQAIARADRAQNTPRGAATPLPGESSVRHPLPGPKSAIGGTSHAGLLLVMVNYWWAKKFEG